MNGKLSFDAWRCIVKESEITIRRSNTFKLFKLSSLNALHNKKVEYNIYVFPLFISLRQMSNFSFDHNNNIRFSSSTLYFVPSHINNVSHMNFHNLYSISCANKFLTYFSSFNCLLPKPSNKTTIEKIFYFSLGHFVCE